MRARVRGGEVKLCVCQSRSSGAVGHHTDRGRNSKRADQKQTSATLTQCHVTQPGPGPGLYLNNGSYFRLLPFIYLVLLGFSYRVKLVVHLNNTLIIQPSLRPGLCRCILNSQAGVIVLS